MVARQHVDMNPRSEALAQLARQFQEMKPGRVAPEDVGIDRQVFRREMRVP